MIKTALFWPDTHYPFEDRRAVALVRKVIRLAKPDLTFCLGDWGDLYNASRHSKKPGGPQVTLRQERDACRTAWRKLEDVSNQVWFSIGNHDLRIESKVVEDLPAFAGVTPDVREFYGMSDAVRVFPYQELVKLGKLLVTHDVGKFGKNASKDGLAAAQHCLVHGHNHRIEITYDGSLLGERHFAMACGWLGDNTSPGFNYVSRVVRRSWQLGFGWARFQDGLVFATPVPIVNYTCCVEGRVFRG